MKRCCQEEFEILDRKSLQLFTPNIEFSSGQHLESSELEIFPSLSVFRQITPYLLLDMDILMIELLRRTLENKKYFPLIFSSSHFIKSSGIINFNFLFQNLLNNYIILIPFTDFWKRIWLWLIYQACLFFSIRLFCSHEWSFWFYWFLFLFFAPGNNTIILIMQKITRRGKSGDFLCTLGGGRTHTPEGTRS